MVITLGQQYNVGEKPTVILYTYINRHADKQDFPYKPLTSVVVVVVVDSHIQRIILVTEAITTS